MTTVATQPLNNLSLDPSMEADDSMEPSLALAPGPQSIDVDETTEESSSHSRKRGVVFGKIHIREYSRCLGDNPATTHGPPLSIDWHYNPAGSYDVEEYEQSRPERRVTQQMLIPGSIREEILLQTAEVTKKQINSTISEIKLARHRRQMSVAMQEFEEFSLFGETILRRLRRLRSGVSKRREQELLWEQARATMEAKTAAAAKNLDTDDSSTSTTESDTARLSLSSYSG